MKILNDNQVKSVAGGNPVLVVIGMTGAVIWAGIQLGQAMAERDNELSCPAPNPAPGP